MKEAPLGKKSAYISTYTSSLLYPIPRKEKRQALGIVSPLPFKGHDVWNAYELSWLNAKGKPCVAVANIMIPCDSPALIESKSMKLYFNSFNQSHFNRQQDVQACLEKDLSHAAGDAVTITLYAVDDPCLQPHPVNEGRLLDALDIECDTYTFSTQTLRSDPKHCTKETLYSHLLKTNCMVTGQPDWATVFIQYEGPQIEEEGLLRYLIAYRQHQDFHEDCVERIFMDITTHCKPKVLTVSARYTRRGGIDINPIRSTKGTPLLPYQRLFRQ